MTAEPHFQPALFDFLRELKDDNTREWFAANKARYVDTVQEPLLRFIADFAAPLSTISPHFVADPRRSGGSMFRIYRDTRFSKDKSPYKTHAAAQFRHRQGRDVHAPGFYLHLGPDMVFGGAGIWHPDGTTLRAIREFIVDNPKGWGDVLSEPAFARQMKLGGESLKRAPRGFDPDHPLIEDLKRKDFIASATFTEAQACSAGFLEQFVSTCRAAAPLVEYLTRALDVEF
jgi:uncharacterized protein (TIGR02453 family)